MHIHDEQYVIKLQVKPGSHLTEPIGRWMRTYGAESVTVNTDDTLLTATFLTPIEREIVANILRDDKTTLFREITFGANVSLLEAIWSTHSR